jgi:hypothetical protein
MLRIGSFMGLQKRVRDYTWWPPKSPAHGHRPGAKMVSPSGEDILVNILEVPDEAPDRLLLTFGTGRILCRLDASDLEDNFDWVSRALKGMPFPGA